MSGIEIHDLGAKLRHARKVKKQRLKDVAAAVGCSESLLSKIECDKVTPSLRTLHRIVSVLDTSIASLFADPRNSDIVLYRGGDRPVVVIGEPGQDNTIRLERVVPYVDGRSLECNIHIVTPGATNGGEICFTRITHACALSSRFIEGVRSKRRATAFILRRAVEPCVV